MKLAGSTNATNAPIYESQRRRCTQRSKERTVRIYSLCEVSRRYWRFDRWITGSFFAGAELAFCSGTRRSFEVECLLSLHWRSLSDFRRLRTPARRLCAARIVSSPIAQGHRGPGPCNDVVMS
ncbi:hypothetical protein MPTK1_6g01730 [Marchantia polymorpha subsp. ruderalis]|uniref:Uncharacterized protein n=2 Tax=Marchantia polymorpha TaxID=3197 RepID=A0AAF6BMI2_MARPO|nr:hypothetical protein MARPO_0052s0031 [Marchantia polymorpha]BBN13216.1 hypothetical protein Mp_6g01730 [Marchantia polymorpha subsp. ruderalis]|eukprot:PTQ38229.1 hypothetical protein MARPO_0052s0031 [Marchantia polymorpha]